MGLFGGLKKIGKFVGKELGKTVFLPGRGITRLARGDFKGALSDIAGGAARAAGLAGGAFAAPALLGGLGSLAGSLGVGGGGGVSGFLGSLFKGIGGAKGLLSLGSIGADLLGSRSERQSSERFEQKRLDALTNFIANAESEFASREPLRRGGQQALLKAIGNLGSSPVASFLKESREGARQPGEFLARKTESVPPSLQRATA